MGSWRLKRQVDFGEELIYKFSPKFVLKAGQSVKVRSCVLRLSFHPPTSLVCHAQILYRSICV